MNWFSLFRRNYRSETQVAVLFKGKDSTKKEEREFERDWSEKRFGRRSIFGVRDLVAYLTATLRNLG